MASHHSAPIGSGRRAPDHDVYIRGRDDQLVSAPGAGDSPQHLGASRRGPRRGRGGGRSATISGPGSLPRDLEIAHAADGLMRVARQFGHERVFARGHWHALGDGEGCAAVTRHATADGPS